MRNILELQEEKSHKLLSASDITKKAEKDGDRALTDGEKKDIDAFLADAKKISAEILEIEENERRVKAVQDALNEFKAPGQRVTSPAEPKSEPSARIEFPSFQARYGSLKAFTGKNAEQNAYVSGKWLRASFYGDASSQRWCSENGVQWRNALSEGSNTAGGYLVPEELNQAIIDLRETYGVFRSQTRVLPMGRDTMNIPRRSSGVTATFTGENVALTESDAAFSLVSLTAKKLGVITRLSTEVADDAIINLADWVAQEFAYAFALKEDQCGFTGDGTSTYGGITGLIKKFEDDLTNVGSVAIADQTANTFAEIDQADISGLMGVLPQYARMGAKFYCSQVFQDMVFGRLMAGAGGNNLQTLQGDYRNSYLGHEVVVSQVLPSGASTDYNNKAVLFFGRLDMASTMGERRGVEVKRSDERYFVEDQIAIKATTRFDINIHDVGSSSGAGPIVALIASSS
jgi:HK97 family phage major capsid protein